MTAECQDFALQISDNRAHSPQTYPQSPHFPTKTQKTIRPTGPFYPNPVPHMADESNSNRELEIIEAVADKPAITKFFT
jgi:hypothetical protein